MPAKKDPNRKKNSAYRCSRGLEKHLDRLASQAGVTRSAFIDHHLAMLVYRLDGELYEKDISLKLARFESDLKVDISFDETDLVIEHD